MPFYLDVRSECNLLADFEELAEATSVKPYFPLPSLHEVFVLRPLRRPNRVAGCADSRFEPGSRYMDFPVHDPLKFDSDLRVLFVPKNF